MRGRPGGSSRLCTFGSSILTVSIKAADSGSWPLSNARECADLDNSADWEDVKVNVLRALTFRLGLDKGIASATLLRCFSSIVPLTKRFWTKVPPTFDRVMRCAPAAPSDAS